MEISGSMKDSLLSLIHISRYAGRTAESLQGADLAAELETAQAARMDICALRAENRYDEVLPGVSVTYELVSDALKENIILADAAALGRAAIRMPGDYSYEVTPEQELLVQDLSLIHI